MSSSQKLNIYLKTPKIWGEKTRAAVLEIQKIGVLEKKKKEKMDFDDWELSVEELDKLERDALRQIAERNASSSSATTSSCLQSSRLQGDVNGSGVSYKRVSFHFYSCFR